ncbi:ribosomal protein S13 [Metschnikowia bicuspidata var. bicuspidata NRRL YB-4993]|uniref:Small ribosomal subunit protein uS13m n=1 Tax=Metschnikowia bicuspidata var. bicuspidata NRRL YB-4993 TaxID=869754 RepID=A0A1A0HBE3_9ASCO|nr:ribosomal protein S13 [Metschnikowia bicuspidata var. bicuspidata NRRL YB-4993]OBA21331.1 ribosomal protein S13 [Metschnikowia bicuspidata var. bicuspidata NRRL YB-4993]
MGVHVYGKAIKHNALVRIGLAKRIFGVGYRTAQEICAKVGIYPQMRMNQLSEPQIMAINKELSEMTIETQLKQKILDDIALKRSINSYAGIRHANSLPVRGQGTRNNARTAKKLNRLDRKL